MAQVAHCGVVFGFVVLVLTAARRFPKGAAVPFRPGEQGSRRPSRARRRRRARNSSEAVGALSGFLGIAAFLLVAAKVVQSSGAALGPGARRLVDFFGFFGLFVSVDFEVRAWTLKYGRGEIIPQKTQLRTSQIPFRLRHHLPNFDIPSTPPQHLSSMLPLSKLAVASAALLLAPSTEATRVGDEHHRALGGGVFYNFGKTGLIEIIDPYAGAIVKTIDTSTDLGDDKAAVTDWGDVVYQRDRAHLNH